MARVQSFDMSLVDIITTLGGGNPGAISVMTKMVKETETIDPDAALGGLGSILSLDSFGIYEHRIWLLYNDVCGRDLVRTLAALRSVQMGLTSLSDLDHAIDGKGDAFDADAALALVREKLPRFGAAERAA